MFGVKMGVTERMIQAQAVMIFKCHHRSIQVSGCFQRQIREFKRKKLYSEVRVEDRTGGIKGNCAISLWQKCLENEEGFKVYLDESYLTFVSWQHSGKKVGAKIDYSVISVYYRTEFTLCLLQSSNYYNCTHIIKKIEKYWFLSCLNFLGFNRLSQTSERDEVNVVWWGRIIM